MKAKRIVPEHEETYIVCDFCKEEIKDNSYTSYDNGKEHYHSMYAGGKKGTVEETCLDKQREVWKKEHFEKANTGGRFR